MTGRKKAILIVDVQPDFSHEKNEFIIPNIVKLIQTQEYDLFFDINFYSDEHSMWKKQQDMIFPLSDKTKTDKAILDILPAEKTTRILIQTRSAFKGEPAFLDILKEKDIEEVHIVGLETDDCILATAFESFDSGFYAYAIEDSVHSGAGKQDFHEAGLKLLRRQQMLN